jgi:hypothetical protein
LAVRRLKSLNSHRFVILGQLERHISCFIPLPFRFLAGNSLIITPAHYAMLIYKLSRLRRSAHVTSTMLTSQLARFGRHLCTTLSLQPDMLWNYSLMSPPFKNPPFNTIKTTTAIITRSTTPPTTPPAIAHVSDDVCGEVNGWVR